MPKLSLFVFLASISIFTKAQSYANNEGKEFWVAYPFHHFITDGTNSQVFTLYISVSRLPANVPFATVTLIGDSSGITPTTWYKRTFRINGNTSIDITQTNNGAVSNLSYPNATADLTSAIPKGPVGANGLSNTNYDFRMVPGVPPMGSPFGIFRKKGIRIQSDVPISVTSHCYGSTSSGATMLLPVTSWGTEYKTLNSLQAGVANAANFIQVIAKDDNTPISFYPSNSNFTAPQIITLNKGQIYQFMGATDAAGNGVDLTGSIVKSLDPSKTIAVFAGSGRTSGETAGGCNIGSRDNDFQQCLPASSWGLQYFCQPFATSNGTAIKANTIYKIIAKEDSTTINYLGNNTLIRNTVGVFFRTSSSTPFIITANKPIMVAQYMTGGNCNSGNGDPEMIYLTPVESGIKKSVFYRTTVENITAQFVQIATDTAALNSLTIDGQTIANNFGGNLHTQKIGKYILVTKGWTASRSQCVVTCDSNFTGITYGLGAAESYGFNIGINSRFLNAPMYNPIVKGNVFYDLNNNGIKDGAENNAALIKIKSNNNNVAYSNLAGDYYFITDSLGTYKFNAELPIYFKAVPDSFTTLLNTYDTVVTKNIALQVVQNVDTLLMINDGSRTVRANGNAFIYKAFANRGTTALNPTIEYTIDTSKITYQSNVANLTPVVNGNKITFNYSNVPMGGYHYNQLFFKAKTTIVMNDVVKTIVKTTYGSKTIIDTIKMRVIGSYDPNEKNATLELTTQQVQEGNNIDYTIHFQNTGNDTAFLVVLKDTLSSKLDLNSLQITGSSHNFRASLKDNILTFRFEDILLVDSTTNFKGSCGFVSFKIKPLNSIVLGDSILNKAAIYFDFNAPIITNNAATYVRNNVVTPLKFVSYAVKLESNNKQVLNSWQTTNELNVAYYKIERSLDGKTFSSIGNTKAKNNSSNEYLFTDEFLPNVPELYYRIVGVDIDGAVNVSNVLKVTFLHNKLAIQVFPNPAKDKVVIISKEPIKELKLVNVFGQIVASYKNVNAGTTQLLVNNFTKAVYFLQIVLSNNEVETRKLLVQ